MPDIYDLSEANEYIQLESEWANLPPNSKRKWKLSARLLQLRTQYQSWWLTYSVARGV